MKKFTFIHKHCSATLTITADTFNEADAEADSIVKRPEMWAINNEEGEEE